MANPLFPDRKSLISHAVSICRKWETEPTRKGVSNTLADDFDDRYTQGMHKGGTYFTEALQRILDWEDETEPKWPRFISDVLREYKQQGGPSRLAAKNEGKGDAKGEGFKPGEFVYHGGMVFEVDNEGKKHPRKDLGPGCGEFTHKFYKKAYSFNVGDIILYGKYKNKKGKIKEFGADAKGNPTVTIEPVPKGRKQDKTMGLFKIWKLPAETAKKVATRYRARCL